MICLLVFVQAVGCIPSGGKPDAGKVDAGEVDAGTDGGQDAGSNACADMPVLTVSEEGITDTFPAVSTAWGANPSDVWAVRVSSGPLRELFRWDGRQWNAQPLPHSAAAPTVIAGRSADDVWLGGTGGVLHHWDGATLTRVDSGTTANIIHLKVLADGTAWALTSRQATFDNELLRWDGGSWSVVLSRLPIHSSLLGDPAHEELQKLLVTEWGDVWFADSNGLFRWHEGTLEQLGTASLNGALWASGPDDVWAGASTSGLKRWNGSALVDVESGPGQVMRIWGTGPRDIWFLPPSRSSSTRAFFHWDGSQFTSHPIGDQSWMPWSSVTGTGPDDVWVAANTLLHWDGHVWTPVESGPRWSSYSLWRTGPSSLWIADPIDDQVRQWNGELSGPLPSTGKVRVTRRHLADVWALGPADVWAVGARGTALHRDGTSWSVVPTPTLADLTSVSGTSAQDVWAVGRQGVVLHWDGSAWTRVESGTTADLEAVWAGPPGFVLAVGDQGTLLRLRDGRWSALSSGTARLNAVWVRSPEDFWVTDTQSTIYHSSGAGLSMERTGSGWYRGVWGMGADSVFAAGHVRQGESWSVYRYPGLLSGCHSCVSAFQGFDVWEGPDDALWFAGYSGALVHVNSYYGASDVRGTCTRVARTGSASYSPGPRALHGAGEHDVWVVGDFGRIHHVRY